MAVSLGGLPETRPAPVLWRGRVMRGPYNGRSAPSRRTAWIPESMRLVTYSIGAGRSRIGARLGGGIVDLNRAYAAHLAARGDANPQPASDAMVPTDMRQLFEGGDRSLGAAREAI